MIFMSTCHLCQEESLGRLSFREIMNVGFGQVDHAPFSRITEANRAGTDDVDMAHGSKRIRFMKKPA